MTATNRSNRINGGLLGLLVGDALGVPVEFTSRAERLADPVTGMRAYGTHNQPAGTWSDDGSLALCTASSLVEAGYDLRDTATRFVRWLDEGYWTPHGSVFDIGYTTRHAIKRLRQGVVTTEAGGQREQDNGNGSLMRILPLALRFPDLAVPHLLSRAHALSCLTHAHPRSQLACGFYTVMATRLLAGQTLHDAYVSAIELTRPTYSQPPFAAELPHYERVIGGRIADAPADSIRGDGYVVHTLEASLWCLLRHDSYAATVLAAVNLGEDTDTTGAVAGGLAGIVYGETGIPAEWIQTLARLDDVRLLASQF